MHILPQTKSSSPPGVVQSIYKLHCTASCARVRIHIYNIILPPSGDIPSLSILTIIVLNLFYVIAKDYKHVAQLL